MCGRDIADSSFFFDITDIYLLLYRTKRAKKIKLEERGGSTGRLSIMVPPFDPHHIFPTGNSMMSECINDTLDGYGGGGDGKGGACTMRFFLQVCARGSLDVVLQTVTYQSPHWPTFGMGIRTPVLVQANVGSKCVRLVESEDQPSPDARSGLSELGV